MYEVIGISEKKGTFQGVDYHNVMLHCVCDNEQGLGKCAIQIKTKFAKNQQIFGNAMTPEDWRNLIGKTVRFYYDQYGQVTECRILDDKA